MAKLTLNNLSNLENGNSAVATLNSNNAAVIAALENTVSRNGASPNSMSANLDMNSNRILNLPAPASDLEPVRKFEITDLSTTIGAYANQAQTSATSAANSATSAASSATSAAQSAALALGSVSPDLSSNLPTFSSISDAAASNTARDLIAISHSQGDTVVYENYTSADDASNIARFTVTDNGRKYRRRSKVLTLDDVGGYNPAATSHTQLLIDLGNELRWRGPGQRFEAPDNAILKVGTDAEMATIPNLGALDLLGALTPCRNTVLNWNGTEIQAVASSYGESAHGVDGSIPANATDTTKSVIIMRLTDTRGITINDLYARQTNALQALTNYYVKAGLRCVYILGDSQDTVIKNLVGHNCYSGVVSERTGSYSRATRARGLFIDGIEMWDTFYGLNFQKNVDYVRVNNYRSRCRRGYLPYNVHDHIVHMESSTGASSNWEQDCIISLVTDPADAAIENTTSDIHVFYYLDGTQDLGTRAALVMFQASSDSGTQGYFRDVTVNCNVLFGSSFMPGRVCQWNKTGTATVTFDNIKLTGYVGGVLPSMGTVIDQGYSTDLSNDLVSNVSYEDLRVDVVGGSAAAIAIDGNGLLAPVTVRNVQSAAGTIITQNSSEGDLNILQSTFSNYVSDGTNSNGSWTSLPGGQLSQNGYVAAGGAAINVTFPVAFKTGTKPSVTIEYVNPAGTETASSMWYKITALSETGFTVTRPGAMVSCDMAWTATGQGF